MLTLLLSLQIVTILQTILTWGTLLKQLNLSIGLAICHLTRVVVLMRSRVTGGGTLLTLPLL